MQTLVRICVFFFKHKTAYEMRISDWSSDVCSSDLGMLDLVALRRLAAYCRAHAIDVVHAHAAASDAMASLAMPWRGPAILMTFHRTRSIETAHFRDRVRNALVGLRVAAVVTASQEKLGRASCRERGCK